MSDGTVMLVDRRTGSTTRLCVMTDRKPSIMDSWKDKMLDPEGEPFALAFTNDGTLLVGDFNKTTVTLYSSELKQTGKLRYQGRELRQICVCRKTGRIAIACWYTEIVVLDSKYRELFRYTGPPWERFNPFDVTFDRHGYMLVADKGENKGIHVVIADTGQHIQTIATENMGQAECLTTDMEGNVVVATYKLFNKRLLTFKYLE